MCVEAVLTIRRLVVGFAHVEAGPKFSEERCRKPLGEDVGVLRRCRNMQHPDLPHEQSVCQSRYASCACVVLDSPTCKLPTHYHSRPQWCDRPADEAPAKAAATTSTPQRHGPRLGTRLQHSTWKQLADASKTKKSSYPEINTKNQK